MTKITFPDEVRAKHVFGETTLGDIWPALSNRCGAIAFKQSTPTDMFWRLFHEWVDKDDSLKLKSSAHKSSFHDENPSIPFGTKVLVREGVLKFEFNRTDAELHFFSFEPLRVDIL